MSGFGRRIVTGVNWSIFNLLGGQCVHFIRSLILARLLSPEDFGCIGTLTIFITVSQMFVNAGFGSALIQKKKSTQIDYSTIFWWNFFVSILLYCLLCLLAPYIAAYFRNELICPILRVWGIMLIINAFYTIQYNMMTKRLDFRTICLFDLSSDVVATIIAIGMAWSGCGVWALIAQQIAYGVVRLILVRYIVRWYPQRCFSISSLKGLFRFGGYIFANRLIQMICQEYQSILIGRRFSIEQVGYYTRANGLSKTLKVSIPNLIQQVLYPVYSDMQDTREKIHRLFEKSIRIVTFSVYPLMFILILAAHRLILFLYGDTWSTSIPYFRILCVSGFFTCLQNINVSVVSATGNSRQLFLIGLYKYAVLLLCLHIGSSLWGIEGLLWGTVAGNFNMCVTNFIFTARCIGFTVLRQIRNIIPVFIIGTIGFCAAVTVYYLTCCHIGISILIFIFVYLILAVAFRLKVLHDVREVAEIFFERRKR